MAKKILVTSALPYVNNIPHLGNLVCVISADVYTRFLKLKKYETINVLGTDEHGTTAEVKALEEGLSPKELVDKYFKIHTEIYNWFDCKPDCYGRTSSKANHEVTKDIFLKLYKNGFIKEDELKQVYCNKCQKFLADRFVNGVCPNCKYEHARGDQCENCGQLLDAVDLVKPTCAVCGSKPEVRTSKHLFINLPKLEPALKKWIKKHESGWSENAKTMTYAWLKNGLKPRCITRDLKWGIPVPLKNYENKVFYSWFDAPIGYISITKETRNDWKEWWHSKNVKLVQFMGKDNIPFHTILFPSFLIGAKDDYTLMDSISVNEYLNYETGQFSKSRNQGVFGNNARETNIPSDVWRYYIIINRPEKTDTQFSWIDFQEKLNNELVANIGNFVNRTITFTERFFNGKVPKLIKKELDLSKEFKETENLLENIELKKALKEIMNISKKANQYFQESEPWRVAKENKEKAANIMANLLLIAKDISILINPFMPVTALKIQSFMSLKKQFWNDLGKPVPENNQVKSSELLFQKMEDDKMIELQEKFSGKKKENSFAKLNLKVARIKEVKQHPDAAKLYIMKIDLGKEQRQIVAGMVPYYSDEELLGKKIIVVSNLKPAKLRGEKSEGMLLAASEDEKVGLLLAEKSKPGDQVFIESITPGKSQITIDEFLEAGLKVQNGKPFFEDKILTTNSEEIKVDKNIKKSIIR